MLHSQPHVLGNPEAGGHCLVGRGGWFLDGFAHPIFSLWLPHGYPIVTLYGYVTIRPMVALWLPYGCPMLALWLPYGCPMVTHYLPLSSPWISPTSLGLGEANARTHRATNPTAGGQDGRRWACGTTGIL